MQATACHCLSSRKMAYVKSSNSDLANNVKPFTSRKSKLHYRKYEKVKRGRKKKACSIGLLCRQKLLSYEFKTNFLPHRSQPLSKGKHNCMEASEKLLNLLLNLLLNSGIKKKKSARLISNCHTREYSTDTNPGNGEKSAAKALKLSKNNILQLEVPHI